MIGNRNNSNKRLIYLGLISFLVVIVFLQIFTISTTTTITTSSSSQSQSQSQSQQKNSNNDDQNGEDNDRLNELKREYKSNYYLGNKNLYVENDPESPKGHISLNNTYNVTTIIEKQRLMHRVRIEYLEHKQLVDELIANDQELPEYASIPKNIPSSYQLPSDPLSEETQLLLNSSLWKLDRILNPFALPKPHIFVHVPKTAGSSLAYLFKQNERSDKFHHFWRHPYAIELKTAVSKDTLFGHFRYGIHHYYQELNQTRIPELPTGLNKYSYMTMLREPVDRVISHYYYHRQNKQDPGHGLAIKYNLREWLEISPAANNEQARMICGFDTDEMEYPETKEILLIPMIIIISYPSVYKFVGLQEKFPESIVLLTHYAGFQYTRYTRVNTGRERVSIDSIEEDIIQEIKRRNQIDISLYEMAKEIFEKEIDAVGRDFFNLEVEKFKSRNKITSRSVTILPNSKRIEFNSPDNKR
eukprot:gene2739-3401_t